MPDLAWVETLIVPGAVEVVDDDVSQHVDVVNTQYIDRFAQAAEVALLAEVRREVADLRALHERVLRLMTLLVKATRTVCACSTSWVRLRVFQQRLTMA